MRARGCADAWQDKHERGSGPCCGYYAVGELCGQADAQSQCLGRPDLCLDNYEPVCGCDGITYSNFCAANAAGFGAMSEGECSP